MDQSSTAGPWPGCVSHPGGRRQSQVHRNATACGGPRGPRCRGGTLRRLESGVPRGTAFPRRQRCRGSGPRDAGTSTEDADLCPGPRACLTGARPLARGEHPAVCRAPPAGRRLGFGWGRGGSTGPGLAWSCRFLSVCLRMSHTVPLSLSRLIRKTGTLLSAPGSLPGWPQPTRGLACGEGSVETRVRYPSRAGFRKAGDLCTRQLAGLAQTRVTSAVWLQV